ncbi:MAG: DUF2975 domain-containing protein [Clostridia bacterium]|nr:DUF2975 domain-containing protein [Clostridia bacterium]
MYKKSIIHHISKITVDILFYLSIVCTLLTPFIAPEIFNWINYPDVSRLPFFTAELLISGIGCIYILFNLKTMYRSLLTGNPFVEKNISCFRKIAITCFAVAIVYIVKAVLDFTLATIIIAIIFIVGCLFCLTLKDLFKQAINYKVENDLTI